MQREPERLDLAPPSEAGTGRALGISFVAHLVLAAALAWGVNWTQSDPQVAFSAEIWSQTVQEAAPAEASPPPPPPPPPPAPAPVPAPPPPAAAPAPPAPPAPQADIAIEREKKRKAEEERKKAEAKEKLEKDKAAKEKAEKLAKDKAEKVRKEEQARKDKEQKERELAKAREDARKDQARKEAAAQAAQDKLRQEQLQRIQGLAGATGAPDARGTAQRASAPSSSYAGKIIEQIKSNTTFTDASAGRPSVVVLVRTSPTGQILSRRVVTSSGNKAWDEAVLRAVDKMGSVPRDVDGRIPEVLLQDGLEIKVTL